MLDIFLIGKDTAAATSLAKKLCGPHKPGAIIPCSEEELKEFSNVVRITAPVESDKAVDFVEIHPNKKYLVIAKAGHVLPQSMERLHELGNLKIILTH